MLLQLSNLLFMKPMFVGGVRIPVFHRPRYIPPLTFGTLLLVLATRHGFITLQDYFGIQFL